MALDVGNGTTIAFATSAFSAQLTTISASGIERGSVETTNLATTTDRTFIPADLIDRGSVELGMQFDPNAQPPIGGAAETVTITFPIPSGLTSGATAVGSGFMTGWTWDVPEATSDDVMSSTATLKWAGAVTWTDAS